MKFKELAVNEWIQVVLDSVTALKSRKCPVCGTKIIVYSDDVCVALYCETCCRNIVTTFMVIDGLSKDAFFYGSDANGMIEV